MFENIEVKKYEEKYKKEYINFKKEFLIKIWSEEYKAYLLKNFKLIKNNYLLLLVKETKIVGAILINFKKNIGYIEELEISSKYQKNGYGKALVEGILKKFPNNQLELLVKKTNLNAIKFYEKIGFKKNQENETTYQFIYKN